MKKIILNLMMLLALFGMFSCEELPTFLVEFDSNGGTSVDTQYIIKGKFATEPNPEPTQDNYEFLGWQLDGKDFIFSSTPITKNIKLKATWSLTIYRNPVFEPILADPSVIRHEGVYYAFGTQDYGEWGDYYGIVRGPILSSTDLVNWKYETSLFTTSNFPLWGTMGSGLWAPDVVKIGDKFVVYYSLSVWGDSNPGVGVMSADHPLGPWTDHGKLFTSSEIGVNNSIDASVFLDDEGNVYMIWGSFRGLYGIELTSDGLSIKNGVAYAKENKVHIAGFDTNTGWNQATYEAPYIIKKDGWYYMFVSSGTCCQGLDSTYNVRVGRSRNPLGPYMDHNNESMLGANRGYQVVKGNDSFVGVGHNGIAIDDAGNYYLVYHGFDTSKDGMYGTSNRRSLLIDLLVWNQDGWPEVSGKEPAKTATKPVING